jgi:hypothetical protein
MGHGMGLVIAKQGKLQAVELALVSFRAAMGQELFVQLALHQTLPAMHFWRRPILDPLTHREPLLDRCRA